MSYLVTSVPYCGFILIWEAKQVHLPLESVTAQIHIADASARVTLTQVFSNTSNRSDIAAQYVFPIPARAAVCAFEMKTQDGSVVHGVVKEKAQAKKEYDTAVSQGKWAGLLSEASKDVFSISVGAIPINQDISVNITYVIDLSDDELLDQVRFQLPTYLGARYGSPPVSTTSVSSSSRAKLSITADIEMASPISKVSCPSHSVELSLGPRTPLPRGDERPFAHFGSVSLTSQDKFLDKDFVLSIQAAKLDYPRCIAETLSNSQTTALSLTLVPRFELPPIASQEYVFLIDRSGSMGGTKMESAKRALIVLLKSLPSSGTSFNIVSFGTSNRFMWAKSKNYMQDTLDDAIRHVDAMRADMGGTEIGSALYNVFQSRDKSIPAAIFLLTDGEVWNLDGVLNHVRNAVASDTKESYIRIFTLGIGNAASTALCEGIARAGNGACLMAIQEESIAGKCARLLKGSRTPPIRNLRVDWGVPEEDLKKSEKGKEVEDDFEIVEADTPPSYSTEKEQPPPPTISMFDDAIDPLASSKADTGAKPPPPVVLRPHPRIQQAPAIIPSLFPGTRFIVSALITSKRLVIPEFVTLKGDLPSGQQLALKVAVQHSLSPSTPPLIHTLAARRLIQDLEDGKVKPVAVNSREVSEEDVLKAAVVRFSTEYQLTSKYASFVAIDEREKKEVGIAELLSGFRREKEGDAPVSASATTTGWVRPSSSAAPKGASSASAMIADCMPPSFSASPRASRAPAGWNNAPPPPSAPSAAPSASSTTTGWTPPSPPVRYAPSSASSITTGWVPPQAPPVRRETSKPSAPSQEYGSQEVYGRAPVSALASDMRFGSTRAPAPAPPPPGAALRPAFFQPSVSIRHDSEDPVTSLARLQSFNGAFTLNHSLVSLLFRTPSVDKLKNSISNLIKGIADAEAIWATVVTCNFLELKLASEKEVWEGLFEKAKAFVEQSLAGSGSNARFDELAREGMKLF